MIPHLENVNKCKYLVIILGIKIFFLIKLPQKRTIAFNRNHYSVYVLPHY